MANTFGVGVRYLMIYPLATESDTARPTYGEQLEIGATNAINANRSTANATADGDDKKVADITMTTGMSIEWTGWGVPMETEAAIYGHKITDGVITETMGDLAPYVGFGYLRTIADAANKKTFKAYFYDKAQAVQGNEESTSGGSSLNLASTQVTFNAVEPAFGNLRAIQEFDTEAAAVAWIKTQAGKS